MNKKDDLFFSSLSNIITILFQLIFYLSLILNFKFSNAYSKAYYFWCGLISLLLLITYSEFVIKRKKQSFFLYFSFLLFIFISIFTGLLFLKRISLGSFAYLIFIQSQISRLIYRAEKGGFPIATYILSITMAFFAWRSLNIIFLPIIYKVIQLVENYLKLNYPKLLRIYEDLFSSFATSGFMFLIFGLIFLESFWSSLLVISLMLALLILITRDYLRSKK